MVNKDEKTKTYCVICSFDNTYYCTEVLFKVLISKVFMKSYISHDEFV